MEVSLTFMGKQADKTHQGASRDLFSRYAPANLEIVVAQAIHNGLVSEDEAGSAALEYLAGHPEVLRKG